MGCSQSSLPDSTKWPLINKRGEVDVSILERLDKLERNIALIEKNGPSTQLNIQNKTLSELEDAKERLRNGRNQNKGNGKDPNIEETGDGKLDDAMVQDVEASEEIDVNEQLKGVNEKYEATQKEIKSLQREIEDLNKLYDERENILSIIFDGAYGSELENSLEHKLQQIESIRSQVILTAHFKWRQARLMIHFAWKQANHALDVWNNHVKPLVMVVAAENEGKEGSKRKMYATECRNNLAAAAQNLTGAQRFLYNIQFPYCNSTEVETLIKAICYIFTDCQSQDRHKHASQYYTHISYRCSLLLKWIDKVLDDTLNNDLADINQQYKDCSDMLRKERMRLIKLKMKEVFDKDIEFKEPETLDTDIEKDDYFKCCFGSVHTTDEVALTMLDDDTDIKSIITYGNESKDDENIDDAIKQIKYDYQASRQRIEKALEENKTKLTSNLEKTLEARRERRLMMNIAPEDTPATTLTAITDRVDVNEIEGENGASSPEKKCDTE